MAEILEVDLLRFEQGDAGARAAVVDGVRRSLATGFVYTNHDLPEDVIDEAYDKLAEFFSMDQATKEKFIAPGLARPDRLHGPPRRDGGVGRGARLEGDAQLERRAAGRPPAAAQVPAPLHGPGAPRGGGARASPTC